MPVTSNLCLLPVQIQQLTVNYRPAQSGVVVSLQHLTNLQTLYLSASQLAAGSSVPPNLRELDIHTCIPAGALAGLGRLHKLTSIALDSGYSTSVISGEDLRQLSQLPQLKEVALSVRSGTSLLEVAAAWHDLPLCSLVVDVDDTQMAYNSIQQLMQHVSAATQLTNLSVHISSLTAGDAQNAPRVAVCNHLGLLKSLECLSLGLPSSRHSVGRNDDFTKQDTEHLSVLNRLSSLELCRGGSGPDVDTTTLCMLAVNLTRLRKLEVLHHADYDESPESPSLSHSYDFRSYITALPAIAKLTTLEVLGVEMQSTIAAQRGLQILTSLTNLTRLGGFQCAGTGALEEFWAVIKGASI